MMELQDQIGYTYIIAAMIGIIGLLLIGMGFGWWLSIQTMLDAGCEQSYRFAPSACQKGMATLAGRSSVAAVLGVGCVASSGGIVYYLKNKVP